MKNYLQNCFKKYRSFLPAFLMSSYVVLFTFLNGFGEVVFTHLFFTLLIILCFTAFVSVFFYFLYRSIQKAALATIISMIAFWIVTPISQVCYNFKIFNLNVFRLRYLVPVVFALLLIVFVKLFKSKTLNVSSEKQKFFDPKFFIFIFVIMNLFVIAKIINLQLQANNLIKNQFVFCHPELVSVSNTIEYEKFVATKKCNKDIYFIIFDSYISGKALLEKFKFDNSKFLNELKERDFFVAKDAFSNYPWTAISLSATFNTHYHKNLSISNNRLFYSLFNHMFANNRVSKFLKDSGYKIVNIPSRWGYLAKNKLADMDYSSVFPLRFLFSVLENMSILSPFFTWLEGLNHKNIFFEQLEILKNVGSHQGPKFIFAHIMAPHYPFILDENGNFNAMSDWLSLDGKFVPYLKFVNKHTIKLIDDILSNYVENKPIIIIQGDHGLNQGLYEIQDSQVAQKEKSFWNQNYGILNAMYLPKIEKSLLYTGISPINNFRLILKNYFGVNIELLKDKSFVPSEESFGKFVQI